MVASRMSLSTHWMKPLASKYAITPPEIVTRAKKALRRWRSTLRTACFRFRKITSGDIEMVKRMIIE
jgi:hypothetical protein